MTFATVFTAIVVLMVITDCYVGYRAFKARNEMGVYFSASSFLAAFITLSYLVSVFSFNHQPFSIASSCYFAGIDWMLVCLVHFAYVFTGRPRTKTNSWLRRFVQAYALFDSIVFAINIVFEISIGYIPRNTPIAPFAYDMKPLYIMHLVFTYALTAVFLETLIRKCLKTPTQYRNQYLFVIAAMILIIVVNAAFLYVPSDGLISIVDCSLIGYSLGLAIAYWAAFSYRNGYMLKSLSMTIFENINQGLVLFDYNDMLIMRNNKAEELLQDVSLADETSRDSFLEQCAIREPEKHGEQYSIQLEKLGNHGVPLRCDFRQLYDAYDEPSGQLYVLTDVSNDTDLLTGFQHGDNFRRYVGEKPYAFDHPTSVVVFDIMGLGEINRTFGREIGDQRIRHLAKAIRMHMPSDSYFVRGYEASLIVVCSHRTEEQMLDAVQGVIDMCGGTVFFGICSTFDRTQDQTPRRVHDPEEMESRNVIAAIDVASRALQVKKMLSSRSVHSQTLMSLVRALRECDTDTEAHVRRTQEMGVRLGQRIGLTDAQIADLRLLCLLHDIGKIGIPLEILNKPSRLTDQEWAVLQSHPEKGFQICMTSDELKHIAPMVLYHHERWDGKGYPKRLSGNEIPVLSRVISIVDAYDAMVNDRAYRKALTPEHAQGEISRCGGTQFDPYLAQEFLTMLEENPEIARGEVVSFEEMTAYIQQAIEGPQEHTNTIPVDYARYMLNLHDGIIEVDDNFHRITGYERGDAVGKMSQYDLIPPEDRAFYIIQVNDQFMHANFAYLKHRIRRKDGEVVWVICYGKRFFDSAERVYRSEIIIHTADDSVPRG